MCAKLTKMRVKKLESKNKKTKHNISAPKEDKFKHKVNNKAKNFKKKQDGSAKQKGKLVADQCKTQIKSTADKKAENLPNKLKKKLKKPKTKPATGKQSDEKPSTGSSPKKVTSAGKNLQEGKQKNEAVEEKSDHEDAKMKDVEDIEEEETIKTDEETTPVKRRHESPIEHTLFVGNLPANTKKVQLMKMFQKFGNVVSVRFRTPTGKKLFKHKMRKDSPSLNAYVVMENTEAVEVALMLSGTVFKGNHIRVTKAESFKDTNRESKRTVFVGNLKYSATEEQLHEVFSNCGEVEYVRTIRNDKGCIGVAYVCFKKADAVSLALELNSTILDNRCIRVEKYSKTRHSSKVKPTLEKLTGAQKRLADKANKMKKGKAQNATGAKTSDEKGKTPYRGVKSDLKKKPKKKKKMTAADILAKKLAPKQAKPESKKSK